MTEDTGQCSSRRATTARLPTRSSPCSRNEAATRSARRERPQARDRALTQWEHDRRSGSRQIFTRTWPLGKCSASCESPLDAGWHRARLPQRSRRPPVVPRARLEGTFRGGLHGRRVGVGGEVAIGFNLLSVVGRAFAWQTVINAAMPPPHPGFRLVFSAFSVGLLGNEPCCPAGWASSRGSPCSTGRSRKSGRASGRRLSAPSSSIACSISLPVLFITRLGALRGEDPRLGQYTSLWILSSPAGVALFLFAFASARHHGQTRLDGMGLCAADPDDGQVRALGVCASRFRADRHSRPVLRLDVRSSPCGLR